MNSTMIKLKNLERSYPLGKEKFFYVLREINLDVEEGDFVSIMGPSGAGKSTLLHILGMHDHGWQGEYFLGEAAVHHLKPKERATLRNEQIGFVFQQYHLLDDLTVYENLDIPLSIGVKSERAALVADMLDRFQIVGKKICIRQLLADNSSWVWRVRSSRSRSFCCHASRRETSTQSGEEIGLFRKLNDGDDHPQVTHRRRTPPTENALFNCATAGSFQNNSTS
jgi:ABC-type glutathione transport system ATPase component